MNKNIKSFMEDPWWVITDNMAEKLNSGLHRELSQNHSIYTSEEITRPLSERGFNDAKKVNEILQKERDSVNAQLLREVA